MSRTFVIVQARLGSTRLPRKALELISQRPIVEHVLERAFAIRGADDVVLAVPEGEGKEFSDAMPFARRKWSLNIVEGHPTDVLSRFYSVAKFCEAGHIVRLTADCPLIDPELCALIAGAASWFHSFSTLDTRLSGFPDGLDCEVFSMSLLAMAHERATDPYDREHVTSWMRRAYSSPGATPYPVLCREQDALSKVKLSVDTQSDLDFVRRIMARIPAGDYSWRATAEAIRAELSEKP